MERLFILVAIFCLTFKPYNCADEKKVPDCFSGEDYQFHGTTNVTKSGAACQHWSSDTPHNLTRTAIRRRKMVSTKTLAAAENFCRNFDGRRRPWCYPTTGKRAAVQYCDMPLCKGFDDCYFPGIQTYARNLSVTATGKTCLRWDSKVVQKTLCGRRKNCNTDDKFPDASTAEAGNYCRQPLPVGKEGLFKPHCYVSAKKMELCNVKQCPLAKCGSVKEKTYYYTYNSRDRIRIKKRTYVKLDTMEECSSLCNKTQYCNHWAYRSVQSSSKRSQKKCYLFKKYSAYASYKGCFSGPKNLCS